MKTHIKAWSKTVINYLCFSNYRKILHRRLNIQRSVASHHTGIPCVLDDVL